MTTIAQREPGIRCEFVGQTPVQVTAQPEIWKDRWGYQNGTYGKGQCHCGREVGLTRSGTVVNHHAPKED